MQGDEGATTEADFCPLQGGATEVNAVVEPESLNLGHNVHA
jgi:hypothetical protein